MVVLAGMTYCGHRHLIAEAGGVEAFVAGAGHEAAMLDAAAGLRSLAEDPGSRPYVTKSSSSTAVLGSILKRGSGWAKTNAATALFNLAESRADRAKAAKDIPVEMLVAMLANGHTEEMLAASWLSDIAFWRGIQDRLRAAGGLKALACTLRRGSLRSRALAARILVMVAASEDADALGREARCVKALVGSLRACCYRDEKISALFSLGMLAQNVTSRAAIISRGGARALVSMLRERHPKLRTYALKALMELVVEAPGRVAVMDADGIPAILVLLHQGSSSDVSIWAVRVLSRLVGSSCGRKAIAAANGAETLFQAMHQDSPALKTEAARLLADLTPHV